MTGINIRGIVIGYFTTTNTVPPDHGFVRTRNGTITTFDIPGGDELFPESINALGEILPGSYYFDGDTQVGGFVRSPGGTLTTFAFQAGIVPLAINAEGAVAGWYGTTTGFPWFRAPPGRMDSHL